jgi:hypothetical protein
MWDTATPLEVGYTVFALCWLPVGLWVVTDALGDLRQVSTRDLVLLARRDLTIDGVGIYLLLLFAGMGARAMWLPPAVDSPTDPGTLAVGFGLILAELLIGTGMGMLAWTRQRVKALNRRAVLWEWTNDERRAAMKGALDAYVDGAVTAEEGMQEMLNARIKAEAKREEYAARSSAL